MKAFPLRSSSQPKQPPSSNKQTDPLSSSPNTITLRSQPQAPAPAPPGTAVTGAIVVAANGSVSVSSIGSIGIRRIHHHHHRHRSASDGVTLTSSLQQQQRSNTLQQRTKTQSPLNPTILSVLGEQDGCETGAATATANAAAITAAAQLEPPPSSPGTPPKKLWERQYGSFLLRNRVKSGASLAQELQQQQQAPPSPPYKQQQDGSIRGGKLFASIFRSSSDQSVSGLKSTPTSSSSRKSIPDELDGTMRRGADKAYYSPRNQRSTKPIPRNNSNPSLDWPIQQPNSINSSPAHLPHLPLRIAVSEQDCAGLQSELLFRASSDELNSVLPGIAPPPPFLPPRKSAVPTTTTQSSAMKKAFTDFHNTSDDANSAYLGDDPSLSGRSLFFAQKNEQLVEGNYTMTSSKSQGQMDSALSSASSSLTATTEYQHPGRHRSSSLTGGSYNSSLDTVQETASNIKNIHQAVRILKQISGVETWQTGRRYLIAPAALAACPVSAVMFLFGNSFEQPLSAEQAASHDPFGMIVLGECLLTYVTTSASSSSATRTVKQWSSALLVLRQNYLLEYEVGADVRTSMPRGYAHLQFATTVLHEHFQDALELHFYGSPCAKADARVLMIRIASGRRNTTVTALDSSSSSSNMDDSVHLRPEIRDSWRTCLSRAAALTKVSDLYDYDETNIIGRGQYAEVRAARRRRCTAPRMIEKVADGGGSASSTSTSLPKFDCALKIFDKDKFWRMVVKGRERSDTIAREASVQATLLSRCGQIPSFLRIHGFFETADKVVLELELLEGMDLFKYISSKNVLNEAEAAAILRDVLLCLDAMSKIGVAHRDVKPANILMCGEFGDASGGGNEGGPRVKVADFGMAAFVGVDGQVRGRCGTPGYVAPEIFTAGIYGGYGNKVDVFSAGVTLYVMLCGYEPFYGETDNELKEANKAATVDFPKDDWGHVSADAMHLVKQMMHAEPVKRLDARQALQHPWFAKNIPNLGELDKSVPAPANSRRDDACILS